ncbi:DUF1292 domain-containing protein [Peribacillus sp. SCS-37]|uniref:DUF1292 domain-containing protein n=1 Tax=Paraperibacillus esterisolvens TaxID=3115296 RepID=UPI003905E804
MQEPEIRDFVIIEDEDGSQFEYAIEALFDMDGQSYALLNSGEDSLLVQVEEEDGEQYITSIKDSEEKENILSAYQIAVEAAPADEA